MKLIKSFFKIIYDCKIDNKFNFLIIKGSNLLIEIVLTILRSGGRLQSAGVCAGAAVEAGRDALLAAGAGGEDVAHRTTCQVII
jgi:hypothetical protein